MSEQNELRVSRRTVLAGLGGVGLGSAGAGFGTSAFFSDTESIEDNRITAGELDLRIDWQQLYEGPPSNTDEFAPYGTAGKPFVNAHPDHGEESPTGEQSLDTDEFDSVDDVGVVRYSDNDANIQEYLTCETLPNFEVPDDFDNGVRTQERLIELDDIKPGDSGEITFSLHLCDNPGYIWWVGQTGEFDERLAEAISVRAWYDLECTNQFDEEDGDEILVESTDLHTFLDERLTPNGRFLNPNVYDGAGIGGGTDAGTGDEIVGADLDQITFTDEDQPEMEHGEILDLLDDEEDGLEIIALFAAPDPDDAQLIVRFSELTVTENGDPVLATSASENDLTEIIQYDWTIEAEYDGEESFDDVGMFEKTITAGPETITNSLVTSFGCTTAQTNVQTPENGQSIDSIEFRYCEEVPDDPQQCFPPEETFCVAFEWELPTDPINGDDSNELQGQTVNFDLGFYTEQCRHNSDPDGPSGFG